MQVFIYFDIQIYEYSLWAVFPNYNTEVPIMAMEEEKASTLPETRVLERAADILKTVAHPARLRIIDFLEGGERAVTEICRHLDSPQPYISQHLNLMKAKAILSSRRNGNQILYSVANQNVVKVIHCVRQHGDGEEQSEAACAYMAGDDNP